jgi:thioredoxin reductase (NADPH)
MNAPKAQTDKVDTDCVIVGAGPAGISAAKWLLSFGVPFRWFSSDGDVGGLLHRVSNAIHNYPGGHFGSGLDLVDALRADVADLDGVSPVAAHVRQLRLSDGRWHATFLDAAPVRADAVILATGTRYRTLGVPGEDEAMGDCVSQSATADGEHYTGRTVAVVGGGDAGFENALRLAEHGCNVWMLLRNDQFKARPHFVERVEANPKIEFYPFPTTVTEIRPGAGDDACRLILDVAGRRQLLDVACLFVRIGVEPVLPAIMPSLETSGGFVVVDSHQQTSADGLFAAGDVTDCLLRSVSTAVGAGATAAKAAALRLGYL